LKGYKKEWVKWLAFARRHDYRLAPPRPADLEDYLTSEVGPRGSVAVIDAVSASFNWHCPHCEGDEEDFAQAICAAASLSEVAYREIYEVLKRVFSALEGRGCHGYVFCLFPTL
jgi:hypothetical protein